MCALNRRQWLGAVGVGLAGLGESKGATPAETGSRREKPLGKKTPLALKDYRPKSALKVPVTRISKARFPVIDVHTHTTFSAISKNGVPLGEKLEFSTTPEEALAIMDERNIRTMVDLTGGVGAGLEKAIQTFQVAHPGRFAVFTEPSWEKSNQPGYPKVQADEIEKAHNLGAKGLKILKTLGLYLRENVTSGPLVKIDDPRFDPMWDVCGELGMPVSIHTSDPDAFFVSTDRFNERFEELNEHPDWSFYGKDFPSKRELLDARNRVFARHPKTKFIGLHVANHSEDLADVAEVLDRYPNVNVEIAARINELGRQPRNSRKFFDKYQDRIMFGTDATPRGFDTPQQLFGADLYEIYFRFLETDDEYFDYAPAEVPPQGRWRIYGLGLPDGILRKVYNENAVRVIGLEV